MLVNGGLVWSSTMNLEWNLKLTMGYSQASLKRKNKQKEKQVFR